MKLEKKDAWIKLSYRVKELEKEIKQLQCPHNGFYKYHHGPTSSYQTYDQAAKSSILIAKTCTICDGVVEYITEEQSIKEQLEQKNRESKVLRDRMKILSPIKKSPTKNTKKK